MVALLSLCLAQAVLADDVSDFKETLQAAEQGNAKSQFYLGVMYAKGQGVPQSEKQAEIGIAKRQNKVTLLHNIIWV